MNDGFALGQIVVFVAETSGAPKMVVEGIEKEVIRVRYWDETRSQFTVNYFPKTSLRKF